MVSEDAKGEVREAFDELLREIVAIDADPWSHLSAAYIRTVNAVDALFDAPSQNREG